MISENYVQQIKIIQAPYFNVNHCCFSILILVYVNSMELHPSRELVASGQKAGRGRKTQAHIRIWSTETLQTLYVFGMGEFEVGVAAVAFSQLVSFSSERFIYANFVVINFYICERAALI